MPPISTNWLIIAAIVIGVIVAVFVTPKTRPDQER
jgi:hypothetical protein